MHIAGTSARDPARAWLSQPPSGEPRSRAVVAAWMYRSGWPAASATASLAATSACATPRLRAARGGSAPPTPAASDRRRVQHVRQVSWQRSHQQHAAA